MKLPGLLVLLGTLLVASVPAHAKEEILAIFNQRKVSIAVPDGFTYASGTGEGGMPIMTLSNAEKTISLQVVFMPVDDASLATEDGQKEFVANKCLSYAEGSVEGSYDFVTFKKRSGTGTYCSFTDSKLVGKPLQPNEFLHVTAGIKTWPGCAAEFTLFSQDMTSADYKAALKLVQDSIEENKPSPAL